MNTKDGFTPDWRYGLYRQRGEDVRCLNRSNADANEHLAGFLNPNRGYFDNAKSTDLYFVIDFKTGSAIRRFRLQPPAQRRFEMVEL